MFFVGNARKRAGTYPQLVPKFLRNRIRFGFRFAGELFALFDSVKGAKNEY